MKKLLLIIILAASALISRGQSTAMNTADDYFAKKSYANASNYYNQVLTVDTANIKALRRMGYCTMSLSGQEPYAAQYFLRALKIQPKYPVSTYYLGVIFMDQAKLAKEQTSKSDFKARAAKYLNLAVSYTNKDAERAIKGLNTI